MKPVDEHSGANAKRDRKTCRGMVAHPKLAEDEAASSNDVRGKRPSELKYANPSPKIATAPGKACAIRNPNVALLMMSFIHGGMASLASSLPSAGVLERRRRSRSVTWLRYGAPANSASIFSSSAVISALRGYCFAVIR